MCSSDLVAKLNEVKLATLVLNDHVIDKEIFPVAGDNQVRPRCPLPAVCCSVRQIVPVGK